MGINSEPTPQADLELEKALRAMDDNPHVEVGPNLDLHLKEIPPAPKKKVRAKKTKKAKVAKAKPKAAPVKEPAVENKGGGSAAASPAPAVRPATTDYSNMRLDSLLDEVSQAAMDVFGPARGLVTKRFRDRAREALEPMWPNLPKSKMRLLMELDCPFSEVPHGFSPRVGRVLRFCDFAEAMVESLLRQDADKDQ